jgi:hypothetical protein
MFIFNPRRAGELVQGVKGYKRGYKREIRIRAGCLSI